MQRIHHDAPIRSAFLRDKIQTTYGTGDGIHYTLTETSFLWDFFARFAAALALIVAAAKSEQVATFRSICFHRSCCVRQGVDENTKDETEYRRTGEEGLWKFKCREGRFAQAYVPRVLVLIGNDAVKQGKASMPTQKQIQPLVPSLTFAANILSSSSFAAACVLRASV